MFEAEMAPREVTNSVEPYKFYALRAGSERMGGMMRY